MGMHNEFTDSDVSNWWGDDTEDKERAFLQDDACDLLRHSSEAVAKLFRESRFRWQVSESHAASLVSEIYRIVEKCMTDHDRHACIENETDIDAMAEEFIAIVRGKA